MVHSTLTSLPAEMVQIIAEKLKKHKDMASLARTCRRMQKIVEPVLYKGDTQHGPGFHRLRATSWAALHDSQGTILKVINYRTDINATNCSYSPLDIWAGGPSQGEDGWGRL